MQFYSVKYSIFYCHIAFLIYFLKFFQFPKKRRFAWVRTAPNLAFSFLAWKMSWQWLFLPSKSFFLYFISGQCLTKKKEKKINIDINCTCYVRDYHASPIRRSAHGSAAYHVHFSYSLLKIKKNRKKLIIKVNWSVCELWPIWPLTD